MSKRHREVTLLVAAGTQSFGAAVVDAVEATERTASAEYTQPDAGSLPLGEADDFDGAVVDGQVAEPAAVVERLTEDRDVPVVLLADTGESEDTVSRAIEAGATDVFPRTTATAQFELIVEEVATATGTSSREGDGPAADQPYRKVFENVAEGLVVHEPDTGEMLDVNDRICEMTGYEHDELVGEPADLLVAEGEEYSYVRASELIQRAREDGPRQFELTHRHKAGHTYPVDVHLALVELDGEERVLASVRDVTERKRREREYEQIFDMAGDGIVIHDPESGEVVDANRQVADLLGYDRAAFLERPLSEFQATGEGVGGQQARRRIREAADDGAQELEWPLETSDGETVWVRARHEIGEINGERRVVALLHDITERKQREREFEQIFDSVNDVIAIHDGETGELLNVNRRMCELTGYEKERVLELGAEGLVTDHPDQDYAPGDIPAIIDRVMDGEHVPPYEQVIETRTGENVWIEVNPTRAVIGGNERVLAISRDITELRRREREYEQIFNSVQDAITVHDPDTGEMVDVNETFCELIGYDRETILELGTEGVSVRQEGYTRERAEEIIAEVIEEGEVGPYEWRIETNDGERVTEVVATTAEIGGETRVVSNNRDITERRRIERRLRAIVDRIDEAMYFTWAEELTTPSLHPDDFYAGYGEIWGRPLEEIFETYEDGFLGTLHPEERAGFKSFLAGIERDLESGEVSNRYSREYRIERPDGGLRWIRSDFYPTEWETGPLRMVVVSRDVTERKRREQRLGVFNRILRHNLRNRLDVIRSHAEALADRTTDGHAERIIRSVDELAGIGAQARRTDRMISTEGAPTDLDLVEQVRDRVEATAPRRDDVTVTTEVPERAPLRANETAVRIAVENAIENALEYADSAVTVAIEERPAGYVVTVDDDGPGIPAEELEPIEAGTETNLQHGRGLGLWQLRWSVDELDGDLSFDTTDGTTVRIALPDE